MHDAPPHADDHTTAGATSQGGSSALAGISASAWSSLDAVDLAAEFGTPAARERRRYLACANVRRGEVSRARVVLTSAAIAPGTDETFAALSDPARRPPSPRQEVPVDRLSFQPDSPAVLTDTAVPHRLGERKS
eukprot:s4415_g2.t1